MSTRDNTEIVGDNSLPEGWKWVTLGDVSEKSQYGWTTKANHNTGRLKLLRTTDITSGSIDWSSVPCCTDEPEDVEKYLLESGDVLISRAGSVGVSFLINKPERAVFASYLIRFRPKKDILTKYFYYYLKSPAYWDAIGASKSGIAVPNVNASKLSQVPIPVAPLDQQKLIVAEIEKQFSRLDEALANLKRVKANLKRYKAAVLKAAVEGRLVETEAELARREGRSFETGAQLLQRILETRRSQWKGKGKYKEPAAPDTTDLPELPEGWVWASLDDVTSKITSGSRDWSRYYGKGTSIFVLAQNVRPLVPDFSIQQLVGPPGDDPSCNRSRIVEKDLLTTIVGANTGQVCLVTKLPGIAYVCQSVALMRTTLTEMAFYLNYWLNSDEHGQRYFERCMYGQGRPHLSFEQLSVTPVAVPPLAEQHRIVEDVGRRFSFIDEIEAQIAANLRRAESLRRSLLNKAFSTGLG